MKVNLNFWKKPLHSLIDGFKLKIGDGVRLGEILLTA